MALPKAKRPFLTLNFLYDLGRISLWLNSSQITHVKAQNQAPFPKNDHHHLLARTPVGGCKTPKGPPQGPPSAPKKTRPLFLAPLEKGAVTPSYTQKYGQIQTNIVTQSQLEKGENDGIFFPKEKRAHFPPRGNIFP